MSRRIFSISLVLSFLIISSLIALNTVAQAQSPTATLTRTPTRLPSSTAYPGSEFVGTPLSGAAPLTVQFTHTNNSILSGCMWTFGDGTTQSFGFSTPRGTCPTVVHTYTSPGSYTVSLRTTKSTNNFSTTTTKTNYIQVSGPTPTAAPTNSLPDLTITNIGYSAFTPTCSNNIVNRVTVQNIGGGNAGAFVVSFNSQTQTVSGLNAGQTIILVFTPVNSATATVDSTNVISESNESNNSMSASLPLPTQAATCTPTVGTPLTPTPSPTLTRTPTRTAGPAADFSGTPLSGNAPLTVSFTHNLSSVVPPGTFVTCTWTFGDGQSQQFLDTCFNTNHTYTSPGTYSVSLQYSPAGGGGGTVTKPNYISVLGGPTSTPTRTPTGTGTVHPPVIPTRTITPTPVTGVCSPATPVSAPFSKDGAGSVCWQVNNISSHISSWNLVALTVNGVDFTNLWVPVENLPPKINGYWYIYYNSSVAWGHFEAQ